MEHDAATPRPIPAGWLEAMDESDADLAAGRIVPAADVHAELLASIARLEAAHGTGADPADPQHTRGDSPPPALP